MSIIPDKLNQLYAELDRLQASGEDVVADIRAEINNLELEYLKTEVFAAMAKSVMKKLAKLRCEIDFSMQFDGSGRIDYSFCTSGTSILMRDSVESKKATKKSEPLAETFDIINKTDSDDVEAEPNEPKETEHFTCEVHEPSKVEISPDEPIGMVYIANYTKLSFMLYSVPSEFFLDFKKYSITFSRRGFDAYDLLIPTHNEKTVRELLGAKKLNVIEGKPDNQDGTIPSQPAYDKVNENLARRRAFVSYLRSDKTMDSSFITKMVEALDSVQLNRIVKSSTRYDSIYDINDYVYILRIIKAIETDLMEKRIKENLIRALKNYHRFLYYTINGRNIVVK